MAAKKSNSSTSPVLWLVLIQWVIAYEWLSSGLGKFIKPDFMKTIGKTLGAFAAKTHFKFYGNFLHSTGVPNAQLFGNLVRYSEIFIGLGLAVGGYLVLTRRSLSFWWQLILVVSLFGGALLNLNFYFAAGWSGPSTEGVNLVMGLVQLILGLYFVKSLKRA